LIFAGTLYVGGGAEQAHTLVDPNKVIVVSFVVGLPSEHAL